MRSLNNTEAICLQSALAAEPEHVNADARCDRSKENSKGCWRRTPATVLRWLVVMECELLQDKN